MAEYIPSPTEWVRDQVEQYEGSGGTEGTTLRETGLPVIIVTNKGNKTGAIRKDATDARQGRRQLRAGGLEGRRRRRIPSGCTTCAPTPTSRSGDETDVYSMTVREVEDDSERARLWDIAVEAFPPYAEYQERTSRTIPVFVAEPA